MNGSKSQALKPNKLIFSKFMILLLLITINVFNLQNNFANANDLSMLFDEGEKVRYIKNEITGREKIFDKNGKILLASYNSRENVGIVNDNNDGKQVLIYKTFTGDIKKENGVRHDEDGGYQDFRIVNRVIFYDLTGDEIEIEVDDFRDFNMFNNYLLINCWTDEVTKDNEDYVTYKKQMVYYDLNSKDRKPIKLFDDFGNCNFVKDYMIVNFSKGNYYQNTNVNDKDLHIFDINMNEYKVLKSSECFTAGFDKKYNFLMHYNRELNINNKKYYEVYYERYLGNSNRRFYNLLDESFDYVFNDDVLFYKNWIYNDNERVDEYKNRLNDKTKVYNKDGKRNNIFEKTINIFSINNDEKWYYILKDSNYIRIVDDNNNDVVEKAELKNLYIESLYGAIKKDLSGKIFYAINQETTDYYSIQNRKLVKILSLPVNKNSRINSNGNTYSSTFIVSIDDGYFYPLTFKSYYEDDWEYFELLELDEVKIYNRNQNIEPFVVKANWIAQDYKFVIDKNQLNEKSSPFYIMQLNDKRLIRVLYEDKNRYELFEESGEKILNAEFLCTFVDDDKDLIIISSAKDETNFYDLDFNIIGHFDKIYNEYYIIDANEPYGKLLCLCTKLKNGNYDNGTILIDKRMNLIRDNIKDIVYTIKDEADFDRNTDEPRRYKYLLLQDAVSNVKYKNGDMKSKTIILDLNLNEVFSTYQKIMREEQFFDENKNMVMTLHIYDDGYTLFDNKMNVIEKGSDTKNCFENIKDKYKADYMYGTEKGMTFQKSEKVYSESMGFAIDGKNYVNLKRPDFFEKINIKDNIVLYKNQYNIKIDKDSEIKFFIRYSLVNTQTNYIIAKDFLQLTGFKDNYFEFANAFEYGFMDYNGKKLISFSIFDDTLYEDMQKQEIKYMYN